MMRKGIVLAVIGMLSGMGCSALDKGDNPMGYAYARCAGDELSCNGDTVSYCSPLFGKINAQCASCSLRGEAIACEDRNIYLQNKANGEYAAKEFVDEKLSELVKLNKVNMPDADEAFEAYSRHFKAVLDYHDIFRDILPAHLMHLYPKQTRIALEGMIEGIIGYKAAYYLHQLSAGMELHYHRPEVSEDRLSVRLNMIAQTASQMFDASPRLVAMPEKWIIDDVFVRGQSVKKSAIESMRVSQRYDPVSIDWAYLEPLRVVTFILRNYVANRLRYKETYIPNKTREQHVREIFADMVNKGWLIEDEDVNAQKNKPYIYDKAANLIKVVVNTQWQIVYKMPAYVMHVKVEQDCGETENRVDCGGHTIEIRDPSAHCHSGDGKYPKPIISSPRKVELCVPYFMGCTDVKIAFECPNPEIIPTVKNFDLKCAGKVVYSSEV